MTYWRTKIEFMRDLSEKENPTVRKSTYLLFIQVTNKCEEVFHCSERLSMVGIYFCAFKTKQNGAVHIFSLPASEIVQTPRQCINVWNLLIMEKKEGSVRIFISYKWLKRRNLIKQAALWAREWVRDTEIKRCFENKLSLAFVFDVKLENSFFTDSYTRVSIVTGACIDKNYVFR